MYKPLIFIGVFSLNINSAGKEAFMTSKTKNILQSCTFLGCGGGGEEESEGHGPSLGGAKFFETSFPHFRNYFTQMATHGHTWPLPRRS